MSDENRLQTEEELWDVLSEPVVAEGKAKPAPKAKPVPKPKAEGRFARSGAAEFKAEPAAVPVPQKEGRKIDGFFFACMAGVAAVSVAATLLIGGMTGGEKVYSGANVPAGDGVNAVMEQQLEELKLENAELRAQLELQKQQIKNLQAEVLDLSGGTAELPTMSTDPHEQDELMNAQLEAYDIFNQIKEAYADFDRETLEQLIPEMDKRISYLSNDAMNEYYLILEYVEMPSNG